jgi:ABC-2 type transport system permease protein
MLLQLTTTLIPAVLVVAVWLKPVEMWSVRFACFWVSAILAVGVGLALQMLVEVLSFWTVNDWGLLVAATGIQALLSGAVIPVALFPRWAISVIRCSPFAAVVDYPLRILVDDLTSGKVVELLGVQFLWVALLWVITAMVLRMAIRQIRVFGG